jgi:hypothetical protein
MNNKGYLFDLLKEEVEDGVNEDEGACSSNARTAVLCCNAKRIKAAVSHWYGVTSRAPHTRHTRHTRHDTQTRRHGQPTCSGPPGWAP